MTNFQAKEPERRQFRLPRSFALVAGLVLVVAALLIGLLQRHWDYVQLEEMAAINNTNVARLLANQLWSKHADLLRNLQEAAPDTLPSRPEIAIIRPEIEAAIVGAPVYRIKIYDLHGHVMFSTESSQIGSISADDEGFQEALGGKVASEFAEQDTHSDFENTVVDRDLLSSYVPIFRSGPGSEVLGVFEVYDDVTDVMAQIRRTVMWQALAVLFVFGSVFLVLMQYVRLGDRLLRKEHERSLALVQDVARIEATSKAKSEFLSNMSHELRTPLNAVIGFAEVIASEAFGPLGNPRYRDYAADILGSGRDLLAIVEKIMELARIELGTAQVVHEPVDIKATLADLVRRAGAVAAGRQVRIDTVIAPVLPALEGDAARLGRAVQEILDNAVKFSPQGGVVVLRAEGDGGSGCRITVTDSGPGMTPEEISLALVPFAQVDRSHTKKHGGAGLGLPLASGLFKLMGGRLEVSSTPGGGTSVTMHLPALAVKPGG